MRRACLVLSSVFAASPVVFAQQPQTQPPVLQPVGGFGQPGGGVKPAGGTQPGSALPTGGGTATPTAPAAPPKPDEETLKHLAGWEAAMKEIKTYYAAATRTDKNTALKREAQFNAQMWLMKPNLARMDVTKAMPKGQEPTAADSKMYISTGQKLYVYDGAEKKRTIAALGPGGAGNNLLLDIMSGMSAKQISERFAVKTLKTDANFVYLEVKPVFRTDKEEFESLTLVLCGPQFKERAYIPRMFEFSREGGKETETWDFPDPKVNPTNVDKPLFDAPTIPGFKDEVRELPKAAPTPGGASPRVPTPGAGK